IYSQRNRSAAVRIPAYSRSEKAKRIEVRFPDPAANGYLAMAAMLMAGLDGIQNKIVPPDPMDKDLYDLPPRDLAKVKKAPGSSSSRRPAASRIPGCGRRGSKSAGHGRRPGGPSGLGRHGRPPPRFPRTKPGPRCRGKRSGTLPFGSLGQSEFSLLPSRGSV